MANDIAVKRDKDGNTRFNIVNGDFSVANSDNEHVFAILKSKRGEWKESPLVGVGIDDYLNSAGQIQSLGVEVRKQVDADGAFINSLEITENSSGTFDVAINAEY